MRQFVYIAARFRGLPRVQFTVYRDLWSLAFVRCSCSIPGTTSYAEGVSFSLRTAMEKCRSEVVERSFVRTLPADERAQILGIAAHPEQAQADEHAWCESLETTFLESLRDGHSVRGLTLGLRNDFHLFISRIDRRWIVFLRFAHDGTHALVQGASKRPFRALLSAWTEFRNLQIYHPGAAVLPRYTKGNRILGRTLSTFSLKRGLESGITVSRPAARVLKRDSHFVVYFKQEK